MDVCALMRVSAGISFPGTCGSSTCKKVPAYFRTPDQDEHRHYTLIEEKRFSVMHNTRRCRGSLGSRFRRSCFGGIGFVEGGC